MPSQEKSLRLLGSLIIFLTAFLLIFAAMTVTTNAHEGEDHEATTTQTSEETEKIKQEIEQKKEDLLKARQERLEAFKKEAQTRKQNRESKFVEAKLKSCEKKEESINRRMDKIAEQRTKQVEVFNKISERTQAFYENKNLTLDNYDELVSDVEAKKTLAESAIEALKTANVDFDCSAEDPLGVVDSFKDARSEVKLAMKDYKTAVKDLIVGVKSVASAGSTDEGGSDESN